MKQETVSVQVAADTSEFDTAMDSLTASTERFGQVFASTLSRSIKSGKSFEDTLRSIGSRFADLALNQAMKPIEDLFSSVSGTLLNSIVGGFGGTTGFAKGGAFSSSGVVPFARGGVVSSPTAFGFSNKLGVMGEAGPEAIMPLQRGSDGRLGIASSSNSSGNSITFNVHSPDATSFRKSEAQVTAMLARAVARGQRNL